MRKAWNPHPSGGGEGARRLFLLLDILLKKNLEFLRVFFDTFGDICSDALADKGEVDVDHSIAEKTRAMGRREDAVGAFDADLIGAAAVANGPFASPFKEVPGDPFVDLFNAGKIHSTSCAAVLCFAHREGHRAFRAVALFDKDREGTLEVGAGVHKVRGREEL